MRYDIKKPEDITGIKKRVKQVLEAGFDATIRTAHHPDIFRGKGPWASLTNLVDLEIFLSERYPTWRQPELTEIFIGQIPKDKLSENPAIRRQHCAWTLSATLNNELIVQIYPHSPHLRDFDDEKSVERFITYILSYDVQKNGLAPHAVPKVGDQLTNDSLAVRLGSLVEQTVRKWFTQYNLAQRLAALTEIFPVEAGYSVPSLQGQARIYPDGKHWILIYDINNDPVNGKGDAG